MKKLFNLKFSVLIISIVIISNSCKKGDKGDMGISGKDGNANVHSTLHTVIATDWYHIGIVGQEGDGYEVNISELSITPAIVTSGLVLVYISNDTQHWTALPFTVPLNFNGSHPYSESFVFQFSENHVLIDIMDDDFNTLPPTIVHYFKIVAIAGSLIRTNPNINWKDYQEVKELFNIND